MAKKTPPSSSETKPKHKKTRLERTCKRKSPTTTSWFDVVNHDNKDRLVIPVGPRFQAELPEWRDPLCNEDYDDNSSKWLGTKIWPTKDSERIKKEDEVVGQGRPEICLCPSPGTVECVKRHVLTKRVKLMMDLGSAFCTWKFNDMGEEVTKLWEAKEEKKFEDIVKMNPNFLGKSSVKRTLECLVSQTEKSIVNYYFNVYIPRKLSVLTRSGGVLVDTDDESIDGEKSSSKDSRKKRQLGKITSSSGCKFSKTRYMNGRR